MLQDWEDNKWFKAIVQILFYVSIVLLISTLLVGAWSKSTILILFWVAAFFAYWVLFQKESFSHAFRDFINLIDGPIDWIKEWIHCRKIPFTNYQINISFLMRNRETTWDIIRRHGNYPNCDPEDNVE